MTPETAVAGLGGVEELGRPVAVGESAEPEQEERLLSHGEVCRITSLHRNTIYKLEVRGEFPERIMITANKVGWHARQIRAWMASRPTASEARERATVPRRQEAAVPRQEGAPPPNARGCSGPAGSAARGPEPPAAAGGPSAPRIERFARPSRQSRRGARRSRR